jgi:hypothetical protein
MVALPAAIPCATSRERPRWLRGAPAANFWGKGIAFNFILRTTRRNWRHFGSIDASVVALYGQIRHTAWRVSDWPVIDAAYWLAVFPRRGWRTELCRTPFDSGLPMDAKVPQRHVAFGRADKQPVRCFIVSPQGRTACPSARMFRTFRSWRRRVRQTGPSRSVNQDK